MRLLLILACCVLCAFALAGCLPSDGDIEVHVDSNCKLVYADGSPADPLALSVRDKVKWVNDNANRVYINFGSNELFGRKVIRLSPGHSTVSTVKSSAGGYDDDFSLDCGADGGIGNPKVVVGDDDDG